MIEGASAACCVRDVQVSFLKAFWRIHWFVFHSKMPWPDYLMTDQCRDAKLSLCCIGLCVYKGLLCALGELRSNCTNDKTVVTEKKEVSTYITHCPSLEGRSEKCLSVLQSGFVTSSKILKKAFCLGASEIKNIGQPSCNSVYTCFNYVPPLKVVKSAPECFTAIGYLGLNFQIWMLKEALACVKFLNRCLRAKMELPVSH